MSARTLSTLAIARAFAFVLADASGYEWHWMPFGQCFASDVSEYLSAVASDDADRGAVRVDLYRRGLDGARTGFPLETRIVTDDDTGARFSRAGAAAAGMAQSWQA
jgi:hypothetical protein